MHTFGTFDQEFFNILAYHQFVCLTQYELNNMSLFVRMNVNLNDLIYMNTPNNFSFHKHLRSIAAIQQRYKT